MKREMGYWVSDHLNNLFAHMIRFVLEAGGVPVMSGYCFTTTSGPQVLYRVESNSSPVPPGEEIGINLAIKVPRGRVFRSMKIGLRGWLEQCDDDYSCCFGFKGCLLCLDHSLSWIWKGEILVEYYPKSIRLRCRVHTVSHSKNCNTMKSKGRSYNNEVISGN